MKRILVIDDDPQFLRMLTEMLGEAGYAIRSVDNGGTALELLKNQGPWDMVLCDILMPRPDGIETIIKIRQWNQTQSIIAMTGGGRYLDADQVQRMVQDFGVPEVLRKPFSMAQLIEAMEQCPTPEPLSNPE
ncbi:Response regulator receiver protein CpdR [Candidatus Magnetaquicoccaceae bacterium FCR-1]|uniref:Response regulator receiver protein CpdR n=1 Tax=Candidatus Magnetaquiglobus chichijimensis TaxID=3141448 RepID=A0ABQ0CD56_9PROT